LTSIHDTFYTFSEFGLVFNFFAKEVACGDMGESEFLDDEIALGAFAGAWGTKDDNIFHV
jgi:hypothetical protein